MHRKSDRRPRKKSEAGNWSRMSAVLTGIEISIGWLNASSELKTGSERRTRNEAPATWRSRLRRSSLATSRDPEQSENPLGPSQGALQLNQAIQPLYVDGAVIQTSSAAQLRTARSKIKICM
ncbi:hypothetical protein PGTUg99_012725 [Puccinia graminis f. sp. tritici]|uniref:Uncharacterized protein n=1 Tax=Puccinia graminis f. sp. tritici TaxID=56615 RepID=A0A5B0NSB6_PUCGR|nr:hypothetical protein PGTUg99_012725 [Puccinia graminis f. sp. tritici]